MNEEEQKQRKQLCDKLFYMAKKKKSFLEICKALDLKDYEVMGLITLMNEQGYAIQYINGEVVVLKNPLRSQDVYEIPSNLEHLRLLLISDTHLACKYDRLDIIRYLYHKAEDTNTNYILHAGDVTDGLSGRPQQLYDLREASYTGQRDYVIDQYPKSDIPTYMIAGNHDLWWVRQCGADIVKDICLHRDDLHYLGSDCEDLKIGKLKIRMYHGKGGGAYAKSYRIQKYLDGIPVEERPHILHTGHIHQAFYMKQDNTHCLQTGCLQDLTPYERSQGFGNDKSCWWIDIDFDDRGMVHNLTPSLETFGPKLMRKKR